MSTVVVGEIATAQFALERTFEQVPELTVEGERAVDHGQRVVLPLIWTHGVDEPTLSRLLGEDPTTRAVDLLANVDEGQLYRVSWIDSIRETLDRILASDGTLLTVSGDEMSWRFQVLYPSREGVSMTNGNGGVNIDVHRIGELESGSTLRYGLTDKQLDALRVGWRRGYFDVPRAIGIEELSKDLGITHQAASERLRRAQASLIKEAFSLHGRKEDGQLSAVGNGTGDS